MVVASRTELLAFLRAAVATWARPDAIFDLVPAEQYIEAAGVLDFNPIGRRQTKKYRPKVPVAKQFAPILKAATEREQRTFLANATIRHGWVAMRAHLNLPGRGEAGPKLIRRSMATIARIRLGEEFWAQGQRMLGHSRAASATSTPFRTLPIWAALAPSPRPSSTRSKRSRLAHSPTMRNVFTALLPHSDPLGRSGISPKT